MVFSDVRQISISRIILSLMPIPAGMEDSIPKPAGTNRNVVFNFHLVGGLFRLPAILIAMLNCGTIKLETYVNVSLLMLTLAVMYCRSRPSANLNLAEISVEISLEVLTTIIFPYTGCMRWFYYSGLSRNCQLIQKQNAAFFVFLS